MPRPKLLGSKNTLQPEIPKHGIVAPVRRRYKNSERDSGMALAKRVLPGDGPPSCGGGHSVDLIRPVVLTRHGLIRSPELSNPLGVDVLEAAGLAVLLVTAGFQGSVDSER
jgi:hypothetical protein